MLNMFRKPQPASTCIAAGMSVTYAGTTGIVQDVMMSSHPRIGIGLVASVLFPDGTQLWIPVWQLTAQPAAILADGDTVIVTDTNVAEYATVLVVRRRTVYVQLTDYPDEYLEIDKRRVFAVAQQVTQ